VQSHCRAAYGRLPVTCLLAMLGIAFEIGVILLLLVLNGVFSMSEMAMVASRKVRLEHLAEAGDKGARAALEIASHPTNFLSTVQVGITLIGVLAGAFGGAGISDRLAVGFRSVAWLAPYAQPLALGLVVTAITYLSLIIGELVPKQLALGHPERIASLVARPMRAISRVGAPLVSFLTGSTNVVFRLFGIRASADAGVTEQDIRAMVEQGAESGVVQPGEHEIVENTFRLGDRQVAAIMTPRLDVSWVDVTAGADVLRAALAAEHRTHGVPILVCDAEIEHVVGMAYPDDLLQQCLGGTSVDLRAVLATPRFVPETMPVLTLLDEFRRSRQHAAVALDEYGGVAGIVTLDDILEALVGELPAHGSGGALEIARQSDGSWLVDGGTAVDDLEPIIDLDPRSAGERRGSTTVGGLVMTALRRLPRVGDHVEHSGARFTVEDMCGRRIEAVRIRLLPGIQDPET
ncbi:MAG TPA: hemolysin family protein, partial [Gemmatimonadaceae bacterium]|nr:hemolysin family protein [Gemmatimonadaceae bacterium]